MARKSLRAPVNVTWEITFQCNLRCAHCLSDSGAREASELSFMESRKLIDQLTAMKVFQVNIGGGEPFIREDFLDLLDYSHEKGLVTCVSTNGLLMGDKLAGRLAKMKMLYLQVSLDGSTAEVNDRIRGEGSYVKIIKAVEALARHHVPFSINTVLTTLNFDQLDSLRALAKGYGADLRVSRFRPSGRAKANKQALGPSKEQLESFAEWLAANDLVRTGDSFFCLTSENRRSKGLDMCGAAKMTCCISPVGDVFPCAFLQEEAFKAGNVRTDRFRDIWNNSPVFGQLRSLNIETCKTCQRFEYCRGGCPAVAYHTYHDIAMPDPECLVNLQSQTHSLV